MKKHYSMAISMSASAITALKWLCIFISVFPTFFLDFVSASSASQISYSDHCSSIVPESTSIVNRYSISPLPLHYYGFLYLGGGNGVLGRNSSFHSPKSVDFFTRNIYATDVQDLFHVEGTLTLRGASTSYEYYYSGSTYYMPGDPYQWNSFTFRLNGFWSVSSGKLCMVESGYNNYEEKNSLVLDLPAVLKLNNLKNSTSLTSLVTGTLESLISSDDPDYFEPISLMFIFARMNYEYTLVPEVFDNNTSVDSDVSSGLSLRSFPLNTFCTVVPGIVNRFSLRYARYCNNSAKNCTPFGALIDFLPTVIFFKRIECSENEQRLRVLIEFSVPRENIWNYSPFNPNTTLIGEGMWDAKTNQLHVAACRFLGAADSFAEAYVGDCSTRLRLRFPAIWTIKNANSIEGHIWSNKTVGELGYFDKIKFESSEPLMLEDPGFSYKYTELSKVNKLCPRKKLAKHKGNAYPNPFSIPEMILSMSVESAKRKIASGNSFPLFVGKHSVPRWYSNPLLTNSSFSKKGPIGISYTMLISLLPDVKFGSVVSLFSNSSNFTEITAEGIYDDITGSLCLVGCRKLGLDSQLSMDDYLDCEIFINIQFSPRNIDDNSGYFKGSIESTRQNSDPLHFDRLELLSDSSFVNVMCDIMLKGIYSWFKCIFLCFISVNWNNSQCESCKYLCLSYAP